MRKVFISHPVGYIVGHLRYGHKEGVIEMTEEEYQDFQDNPEEWLKRTDNDCMLDLIVDDWEVDSYDPDIEDVEWRLV